MDLNYFLTGGSGRLGKELIKNFENKSINVIYPPSRECDINDYDSVFENLLNSSCLDVIHCAAKTNVKEIQTNPLRACETNIVGTFNIMKACIQLGLRMIFISTDHVFDGRKGNYKTSDYINPLSRYAKTKAAAELMVQTYDNSLIIRTSFYNHDFPYQVAYEDQWSSKDYVDVIAPMVMKEIISNKTGLIHVGMPRRTIYDIARLRNTKVKRGTVKESSFSPIPVDTSFCFEDTHE